MQLRYKMSIAELYNLSGNEALGAGGAVGGVVGGLFGSIFGALIALGLMVSILIFIAFYVYLALALMTIAKKLNYKKSWLAWIPIANNAMVLHLGGFHWAWIFLILIPILGWIALAVLSILAMWRIFVKLGRPGWWTLLVLIPRIGGFVFLVMLGIVAWGKDKRKVRKK